MGRRWLVALKKNRYDELVAVAQRDGIGIAEAMERAFQAGEADPAQLADPGLPGKPWKCNYCGKTGRSETGKPDHLHLRISK